MDLGLKNTLLTFKQGPTMPVECTNLPVRNVPIRQFGGVNTDTTE